MSKLTKSFEQAPPLHGTAAKKQQKLRTSNSGSKFEGATPQLQSQHKDKPKTSNDQYADFRLHLRDPQILGSGRQDDFSGVPVSENIQHQGISSQPNIYHQPTRSYGAISHQKQRSQMEIQGELNHSKYNESYTTYDAYPTTKENSFSRFSVDPNDFNQSPLSLRFLQFSSNQPEMAELVSLLEQRFSKLETRLETNESLIHLHDEMQRLKNQESRNTLIQEEQFINQVNARIGALESKIKLLEEIVQSQKVEIDFKLDEFMKKVEKYLEKFVDNTYHLAKKVESLHQEGDLELKQREEKLAKVDGKVDNLAQEIREKLKAICDTVEDIGKVTETTASSLSVEKENFRKLEQDFFKLLTTCKESNDHAEDYKWLADEISFLKYRQIQLMNLLNPSVNHNASYTTYQES